MRPDAHHLYVHHTQNDDEMHALTIAVPTHFHVHKPSPVHPPATNQQPSGAPDPWQWSFPNQRPTAFPAAPT